MLLNYSMKYIGIISKKRINNKEYYYHQYRDNGKMVTNIVSPFEAYDLAFKIKYSSQFDLDEFLNHKFKTKVLFGAYLYDSIYLVKNKKRRFIFDDLNNYIKGDSHGKVFILYGLRRTGKTTLMFQAIESIDIKEFSSCAYITINENDTYYNLMDDLDYLCNHGFKYIFIDEITLLDNFIAMSSTLSDFYALRSKIIVSGTDSLSFLFSAHEELYDRAFICHTTFISYKEFSEVLGINSIDKYIEYGGTMAIEGVNYNNVNTEGINEYVDSAIAHNIIHSLKYYNDGDHFLSLYDLYEKGELVNAINRIVEDQNHRFAISTIERTFKSHDYGSLKELIRKNIDDNVKKSLNDVDENEIVNRLMKSLDIINKDKQTHKIDNNVIIQIEEYLRLLDVCNEVDEVNATTFEINKKKVITQPGLRYSQAKILVNILMNEKSVYILPSKIKKVIVDKLLSDIKGKMLEEIVIYHTSLTNKNTFKLVFPIGEYDMVTYDEEKESSSIFEIKYSKERDDKQSLYLKNDKMNDIVSGAYYPITQRTVLYRGETIINENDISYINVSDYLKSI